MDDQTAKLLLDLLTLTINLKAALGKARQGLRRLADQTNWDHVDDRVWIWDDDTTSPVDIARYALDGDTDGRAPE